MWEREVALGIEERDRGGLATKFVMVAIDLKLIESVLEAMSLQIELEKYRGDSGIDRESTENYLEI